MSWQGMWQVWGRREMHATFWWGNLKFQDLLENLGVDGSIILKCILKKGWESMDWIHLAQYRNK
jgi:uncharacterized protein YjcR